MSEDLEGRLRTRLRELRLPPAPDYLRSRAAVVMNPVLRDPEPKTVSQRREPRSGNPAWLLLPVAATVAALVGMSLLMPASPPPTVVDGLPVMTVSEVLADRAAGGLRNQSVAVGGYWSDVTIPTTGGCMLPGMTGELACASALEGITELDEPLMAFGKYSEIIYQATGPHISPYVPRELPRRDELFMASYVIENRFITTPIVVVGHFDDPRSEYCEPDFKQRCMDRLVVDMIAYFNRALTHVWTPAPGVPTIEPPPP